MTTFSKLTDDFYVAPQLDTADFAEAAAMGIRTVINNRPDGEAPDQLSDEEAAALADAHGLAYAHVPVVSGNLRLEDITLMRAAIAGNDGPFLAYCRSGTRSCHLWALAEAASGEADRLIETAARAGYDLHGMRPFLEEIRQRGGS